MPTDVLFLEPDNFTDQMWGGDWIPRFKSLPPRPGPVAESWEFSTRAERPTWARLPGGGRAPLTAIAGEFPILIKFIDAADDLSLQVHPSDDQHPSGGKSEAWLILDVGHGPADGYVYAGFNKEKADGFASRDAFESVFFDALAQANAMGPSQDPKIREKAERLLVPFVNKIKVRPGDVIEVRPGLIHATGRGVRLFEIQQDSDVTYRVWDWNRPDAKKLLAGKTEFRELHLAEARRVLDFKPVAPEDVRPAPHGDTLIREADGKFALDRLRFKIKGDRAVLAKRQGFQVLTAIKGSVSFDGMSDKILGQGHSAFVPAGAPAVELVATDGPAEVLRSYVPV